jgi:hypothetical protein
MMAVATGNKPPFDNIVVSSYTKFGRHQMEAMDCRQKLRDNGVILKSAKDSLAAQLFHRGN